MEIVTLWEELQHELFAHSWGEDIGRFRSRYAFRGLSDADYRHPRLPEMGDPELRFHAVAEKRSMRTHGNGWLS